MSRLFSGHYPIDARPGELERLHLQSAALAPETERMLDLIGVTEGWRCVDLGCGPGGILELLSRRVGANGHVFGVDMNPNFLEVARAAALANVTLKLDDVYTTDLPPASFDFVHMRFVASTAGTPERLRAEAKRLAKRNGVIALQEPDGSTLNCYPAHQAWEELNDLFLRAFRGVGADVEIAKRLYHVAMQAGLSERTISAVYLGSAL